MKRPHFKLSPYLAKLCLILSMVLAPTFSEHPDNLGPITENLTIFEQSYHCQVYKCAFCHDGSPYQCEYCNQGYQNHRRQCRKEVCSDLNCVDCDDDHPKQCFLCINGYSSFMSKCAPMWQFYILYAILTAVGMILVLVLYFNLKSRSASNTSPKKQERSWKKPEIEMPMLDTNRNQNDS